MLWYYVYDRVRLDRVYIMSKQKNTNLRIFTGVFVLFGLFCLFLILFDGNFTYANESNVYYLEDLKVGDVLPYESIILTTEDYHGYSGFYYDHEDKKYTAGYINYASIFYCVGSESCGHTFGFGGENDDIGIHSTYTVRDYMSLFGTDNDYIGWIVKDVYSSSIYLEPVSDYSKINRTPALDNSYTIDTYFAFSDNSLVANYWFSVRDIADYKIEGESFWIKDNNVFHFRNSGNYTKGDVYRLTFTFSAMEGEVVTFDTRSWLGYHDSKDTFEIAFNGESLSLPTGRHCSYGSCEQSADLYETVYLPIEESGEQTLSFTYSVIGDVVQSANYGTYTYGYVRGVSVLSFVNEGKMLDTSLVNEGGMLYYMSIGENGYTLGERLVYTDKKEVEEEQTPVIENPTTVDCILFVCCAFLLSVFILKRVDFKKIR